MPTREQLLGGVRQGMSYDDLGKRWGIPAGQAYLIATGLPADGSDVLPAEDLEGREGLLDGSTQHLANPPTEVPTEDASVEAWLKARVAADEQLRRAAEKGDDSPPRVQGRSKSDSIIDVLGRQHNQVKYLQEELEAIPGVKTGGSTDQQAERGKLVDMIRKRVALHEKAEQAVFWPLVREELPDGAGLADRGEEQEQHGHELLGELKATSAHTERFDELVEELVAALRKHVAFEDMVFLKVQETVGPPKLLDLVKALSKAAK